MGPSQQETQIDPHGDVVVILAERKRQTLISTEALTSLGNIEHEQLKERSGFGVRVARPRPILENSPYGEPRLDPHQFRVSSKHLTYASPVFQRMLEGPWKEGTENSDTSLREVQAGNWETEPLRILLNIIHGRFREVPKQLDLLTLTKVAVLVDYYNCHEIVEFCADRWISQLENKLPTSYGIECVLWICVSSVFQREQPFRAMTALAVKQSKGTLDSTNLPIVDILDMIDERRQDLIGRLFAATNTLRETLCREDKCSYECSSRLLGGLMKAMYQISNNGPDEAPYKGHSLANVLAKVSNLKEPTGYGAKPCCSLNEALRPSLDEIRKEINGFRLSDLEVPAESA